MYVLDKNLREDVSLVYLHCYFGENLSYNYIVISLSSLAICLVHHKHHMRLTTLTCHMQQRLISNDYWRSGRISNVWIFVSEIKALQADARLTGAVSVFTPIHLKTYIGIWVANNHSYVDNSLFVLSSTESIEFLRNFGVNVYWNSQLITLSELTSISWIEYHAM